MQKGCAPTRGTLTDKPNLNFYVPQGPRRAPVLALTVMLNCAEGQDECERFVSLWSYAVGFLLLQHSWRRCLLEVTVSISV